MRLRRVRTLLGKGRRWLGCGALPWSTRLGYAPALAAAAARDLRGRGGAVEYLGRPFRYDDPRVPLLLLAYPDEVLGRVVANAGGAIRTVLDVGGNLGQFARTFAELAPGVERVDVLEPNPTIFPLLRANTAHLPAVRCFDVGVGAGGRGRLHFTPGGSAIGSLVAENARRRPDSPLVEVDVPLVADVGALTGRREYDLLKVDVEGHELEVLEALEGVTFRWLFLEVSGRVKRRGWRHSDLHALLARRFGPYDLRYHSEGGAGASVFEVLLERVGAARGRVVVLMGVAGAGKTTVGRALAAALGWTFVDADDLHPPANVEKMRRGAPLDEADRAPWLAALRARLDRGDDVVLACSALRAEHRRALGPATFALLDAPDEVIAARLAGRAGHFAGPALLPSQRATLERPAPDDALALDATRPVEALVAELRRALRA